MSSSVSVDDLRPGDHACLTYSDAEERLDIVAAFVRDGLGTGQKVVCFTDQDGMRDIHVNLAHLRFVDAAAAGAIGKAAVTLPPGRSMVITCHRVVAKVLDLVGASDLPAVRVRVVNGRP